MLDHYKCHLQKSFQENIYELGCEIEYIPAGYTCVLQPIDVGYKGPLKRRIKNFHSEWCIKHYQNLGPDDKFPIPCKRDIIDWVHKSMKEIDGVAIHNTFLSIGYYHPEDDMLDIENELRGFEIESDVLVDQIDNLGPNLVILDTVVEESRHLVNMLEALLLEESQSGAMDEDDLATNEIIQCGESQETVSDMSCGSQTFTESECEAYQLKLKCGRR
jgi:hypothetical protein